MALTRNWTLVNVKNEKLTRNFDAPLLFITYFYFYSTMLKIKMFMYFNNVLHEREGPKGMNGPKILNFNR